LLAINEDEIFLYRGARIECGVAFGKILYCTAILLRNGSKLSLKLGSRGVKNLYACDVYGFVPPQKLSDSVTTKSNFAVLRGAAGHELASLVTVD
jgi:hypothetical protein